jgi:hypothetical protein
MTQVLADELAIGMHNAYALSFAPVLALAWSILETNVVLFDANDVVYESVTASPTAGQDSGPHLPANNALVISWKTSAYYRGGHTRTYLCGIAWDRIANAKDWTAQTIADFDAAALAFRNAVNSIGLAGGHSVTAGFLRLFKPKGSTVDPPNYYDPPLFYPWVAQVVHPRVDSQRRRLGREAVA